MIKIKTNFTQILLALLVLTFIGTAYVSAQSKAHERSQFAIIDPTYSSAVESPESTLEENTVSWLYGHSELESWRLQVLQERKDSAKLKVRYPGVFHKPFTDVSFRLDLKKPFAAKTITFRAVGQGKVYADGALVGNFDESDKFQSIELSKSASIHQIQFDINASREPPTLLIENGEFATSNDAWEWKPNASEEWESAFPYSQNKEEVPPHRLEDPIVKLSPVSVTDNLYDFGKELFGTLVIQSQQEPILNIGESETEALDVTNTVLEQSLEVIKVKDGLWKTKSPLAFRYVYLENSQPNAITCEAIFYPAAYQGAFACSDSVLTQIWMNSAYTLRINMHDFLLDGMKRDRLPWTGDLAMSLFVNAHTFSDPELVRRSLVALGRGGIEEQDINGIIDYSLWWIIAQDQYQLYFGDSLHLAYEWKRIKEALSVLSSRCDANGFLIPKDTWLFIDWVEQDKWTALQILWWWAQNSAVQLAERVGDPETADYWTERSKTLQKNLSQIAWNEKEQAWVSSDTSDVITRHPNFLAVISGLAPPEQYAGIKALLEKKNIKHVGTPYMAGFEVMALARLGNTDYMLEHVIDYWGGMLKRGATTFWEAYDPTQSGKEQYAFYGRPYAKSLCHAWSAGPAAFLPSALFGLRPLEDGWKRFSLNPNIGQLEWASVCLPTKYGNVLVDIEQDDIQVTIPAGTTVEWKGEAIEGPRVLTDKL